MNKTRLNAIREELAEVEHLAELKAIWCQWEADRIDAADDMEAMQAVRVAAHRLRFAPKVDVADEDRLKDLLSQLAQIRGSAATPVPPAPRMERKYRLLKTDVSWSTKPQVHALMYILEAHANPGDVLNEGDIVNMMVENEQILQTKQGGKRIWDYYKGDHNMGLVAHGNLEKL